jgi:hypothetical protein
MLALLAIAALLLAQGKDCAACRVDPRRAILCAAHTEAEWSTLREARAALHSKEAAERIRALERVAALTQEHQNAPSVQVARFLADGLSDPSLEVRTRALELIVDGQHKKEAAKGVVRGLDEALRTWRELDVRLTETDADPGRSRTNVAVTVHELLQVPAYVEAVLSALSAMRDERALIALVDFVQEPIDRTPGRFLAAGCEALLALDTRKGTEVVVDVLIELDALLSGAGVARRFGPREGAPSLIDKYKSRLENADAETHEAIRHALEDYARGKAVAPPEGCDVGRCGAWREWLKAARDSLPATL